jgi:hypothetical protein
MTNAARSRVRGAISFILTPLVLAALASPSLAKKPRRGGNAEVVACINNYKSGFEQEKSGHLLEARELFIRCSKSACGSPLRDECTMRFTQLGTDIPSVVPVVTSAAGKPVLDVEVQVDGRQLTSSLDGHSFIMNPGPHEFSFSRDGHIFATQSLLIVQGQRNRLIAASLQPAQAEETAHASKAKRTETDAAPPIAAAAGENIASAPPAASDRKDEAANAGGADLTLHTEPTPRRRIPTLSLVTAGVGVAALGAGALLTSWGRKDTDLLGPCSPRCQQSSADHIHNLYLAADIAIGAGIAAFAGSYWAYAHSRSSQAEDQEAVASRSTPTLLLAPTPSGAIGALSGRF